MTSNPNESKRARAGACAACRTRKRRCIPSSTWDGCRLCQALSIPCTLRRNPTSLHVAVGTSVKATLDGRRDEDHVLGVFGSSDLVLELVPLYFQYVHNIAHTIFHEPSFMDRLREGKASMTHVYAMCALAARYSGNRVFKDIAPCSRGKIYAAEAIRRCQEHMITPTLETVQGFLLVGFCFGGEGNIQGKHVYVGLARLHADLLCPADTATVVLREERRRTWLTIYIAVHWSASDMAVEPTSPFHDMASLPEIDDADFQTLSAERLVESRTPPSSKCDMWAQMGRTLNIYTRINVLLRRLSQNAISFEEFCKDAAVLEHSLDQWAKNLPPNLAYSYDNFMLMIDKQVGKTFLSMHIGYYHFRQMLLFPFLDTRLARWTTRDRAAKCKESASIVSDILRYSQTRPKCKMNYFIYGHIAVVSSSVHLHTLLCSDDQSDLSSARQRLVFNFQFLMSLKAYWSIVDHYVTHLRSFQNYCRDSMSDAFVLDNWMARFLTEHSSALSDRRDTRADRASLGADELSSVPSGLNNAVQSGSSSGFQVEAGAASGTMNTKPMADPTIEINDLSQLLGHRGMTGEAIVNSALNWLLDDDLRMEQMQ
ncbi:putative C6 transcription factor [Penicillium brasilianum]|uniref:Putative C6 transcription factor n=1 Tax=Penicillium brasilianum TaxID=104259 RepID=A0A1S9RJW0_PENBI|nr:putative C6 transcription factor [Penicillium brasilianum]